jgi:pyruvate,orthophosphate dikinase
MASQKKWIYFFGEDYNGSEPFKNVIGGKGANLSIMTKIGLPVPSGFCISCEACVAYHNSNAWPAGLREQFNTNLDQLQAKTGKRFGDPTNPLLLSVRSGARISMPGMMDTVLNLGLNEKIVQVFAQKKGERFAFDSYRRFITMFSDVVVGIDRMKFEHTMDALKEKRGVKEDTELTAADLKQLCTQFLALYKKETGEAFPQDPIVQLERSVNAVFNSWTNDRAIRYRVMNRIPHDIGTGVNVQEMVFGNMGDDCATGVAFTRNPSTGENKRYGEFLPNAQGEDVVAGIRTPLTIDTMKTTFPECAKQLYDIFTLLEDYYSDMQDIEFTIERNKLFILQTRNGKRTAGASVKMAVDMVKEGRIDKRTALLRLDPEQIDSLLHKQIDPKALKSAKPLGQGLPASPGAAVGQIVFTGDAAEKAKEAGKKPILVRLETSPEDIKGMAAAEGILTARGGMTSHAAVVARGMNVCCVAGASDIKVDEEGGTLTVAGKTFKENDFISLDGNTGKFYSGKLPVVDPEVSGDFDTVLKWCSEVATTEVRANADTPHDAQVALNFGARGIGLCRTEQMFFAEDRINIVREMIIAANTDARVKALDKLLPFQRADFHGILGVMSGLPVIIRLIDPPLHEFLPHEEKDQEHLAKVLGTSAATIKAKVDDLHEFNPMLGFRGCRLGVVYPEINAMQVRAIFQASLALQKEGKDPRPEIEIPLVGNLKEMMAIKKIIKDVAKETGAEGKVHYKIGTMIETPRAALKADELATEAEFMSFGTNDLTQMTCGFSRDDAGSFLKEYVAKGIYARDPFQSIDQAGVGRLMRICVNSARSVNRDIDIGICGEHGGEPESVDFCHRIGLNNVSCSPYRVPIARLSAAQAAIRHGPAQEAVFMPSKL